MIRIILATFLAFSGIAASFAQTPNQGSMTPNTPPASPTGSLISTPSSVFNIMDYGAKCDGVTNDNTAVNAAFAAAAASAAYTNNNAVSIVGPAGARTTGCVINSINGTIFTAGTGSNTRPRVEISNMTLLCQGVGNVCLDLMNSRIVHVHDLSIRGEGSTTALTPEICIQVGAPTATSAAWNYFERVTCNNSFALTALYNFASENVSHIANMWVNANTANGPLGIMGAITSGSAYTNGTYTSVPLTGGSGTGALATIVVSGTVVTAVTITYEGRDYVAGDSLSAASANIGGTGTGFAIAVTTTTPYAVILDGQNHWRAASAFVTVTNPVETWQSLTLLNFFGDNIRNTSPTGGGLWSGWTMGLRIVQSYVLNASANTNSSCLTLFDNGVVKSGVPGPNPGLNIELNCEGSSPQVILLAGANASPILYSPKMRMSGQGATSFFRAASNITSINVQNADWSMTFPQTMQMFGSAKLWTITGRVEVPSVGWWNAPSSFTGNLTLATIATPPGIGPLDVFSTSVGLAISCARKLSRAYIGPLCKFQRTSDTLSIDVFSDSGGNLDQNAFTSFCNGTTCKVLTAYDQSGNGNNCTQATALNQPTMTLQYSNLGNRPAMQFGDLSAIALSCPAAATINNPWNAGGYISIAADQTGLATGAARIVNKVNWKATVVNGGSGSRLITVAVPAGADWSTTSAPGLGARVMDFLYDGSNTTNAPIFGFNGTTFANTGTQPTGAPPTTDAGAALVIGNESATVGVNGYPGYFGELLLWKTTPTAAQLELIRRNQGAYYGLGATVN